MQPNSLIFVGLTMIAVGGLFYAFVYPYLSGEVQAEKRKAAIKGTGSADARATAPRMPRSAASRLPIASRSSKRAARARR